MFRLIHGHGRLIWLSGPKTPSRCVWIVSILRKNAFGFVRIVVFQPENVTM